MKRYIEEALDNYLSEEHYPWHMPGHKRQCVDVKLDKEDAWNVELDMAFWKDRSIVKQTLDMAVRMDVTEVPGTDDLHVPEDFIKASMDELKYVYGTFASYYLVNGSTCGMMSAISAAVKYNSGRRKIIVARNCHKSVYNIVQLLGLEPIFLEIEREKRSDFPFIEGAVSVKEVERVLQQKDICAMVLSSPNYNGVMSDIAGISRLLKKHDILLIVDEAHGAHLPFLMGEDFPKSAIFEGADIVVQSLHKTLPALTQTAILHVMKEEIDELVRKYISVFMSSSPSYILLASMEKAVADMEKYRAGTKQYEAYKNRLHAFYHKVNALQNIKILSKETCRKIAYDYDETRIVLWAAGLTGEMFQKQLEIVGSIVIEMSGIDYVVLISTVMDSKEAFEHLYETLQKIDGDIQQNAIKNEQVEDVFLQNAILNLEGKISKKNIFVYPPGSYIVQEGDVVSKKQVSLLLDYLKSGKRIQGIE